MTKSKKPKKKTRSKPQSYTPNLSETRYHKYFLALEEAENEAHEDKAVFWDVGPGERPDRVKADFQQVARKEGIPVTITIGKGNHLEFRFHSKPIPSAVRVRRDGEVLEERRLDPQR